VSLAEYAGGKRCLRAYIAVHLQIHCNPSSYQHFFHTVTVALHRQYWILLTWLILNKCLILKFYKLSKLYQHSRKIKWTANKCYRILFQNYRRKTINDSKNHQFSHSTVWAAVFKMLISTFMTAKSSNNQSNRSW